MKINKTSNLNVICHYRIASWAIKFIMKAIIEHNIEDQFRSIHDLKTVLNRIGYNTDHIVSIFTDEKLIFEMEVLLKEIQLKEKDETSIVSQNIEWLGTEIGLSKIERQLLELATYIEVYNTFGRLLRLTISDASHSSVISYISSIFEVSYQDISDTLNANGRLIKSGLFARRFSSRGFESVMSLISGLSQQLSSTQNKKDFFSTYVFRASPPALRLSDYYYIENFYSIIIEYLEISLKKKRKGVNILLYGTSGTGKTELAKVINSQLPSKLYEVAHEQDGDPLLGSERFSFYQLGQQLLQNKPSIILFDEIEDIFPSIFSLQKKSENLGKALITTTLENNPIPTIWISNHIFQIDPAYLRRFDLVFEIKVPPLDVRKNMIRSSFKSTGISREWIEKVASHKSISPALISNTANIAKLLNTDFGENLEKNIDIILNQLLKAVGQKKISPLKNTTDYNLALINSSTNISALSDLLHIGSSARICLYGPSGTGKTAFAEHISKKLGIPLFVKRASDLLGSYVGETEANIAKAFSDASDDEVIFLIDEADSFLQKRTKANNSWEVSQVNELLTQMENYQGILFCTTNLMKNLDGASLRRFDLKVKLDFLTKEQAWKLFKNFFREQRITIKQKNKVRQELDCINYITPGDFAIIKRSNKLFQEKISEEKLLQRLKEEVSFKVVQKQSQGIGFISDF